MAEDEASQRRAAPRPAVFTIPPHRPFADALAAGLLARAGGDPLALARGLILLPNNRARRAVTDAFVRRADRGLLLPRMAAIGDPDLGEALAPLLDPADDADPIPPAIDPLARRIRLAALIATTRAAAGQPVDLAEAMRLAADLGRVLDQLIVERVDPARLASVVDPELSGHWQASLDQLRVILDRWPAMLAAEGAIDAADRRNRLLDRAARRWRTAPPAGTVIAAGITDTAPAVTGLLRVIARMPGGSVVLPGLDRAIDPAVWDALGPHEREQDGALPRPPLETHPQYALKRQLDAIGVARDEVGLWRANEGSPVRAVRTRAINNAMLPAEFTSRWQVLPPAERRLSGVEGAVFATPAAEAQGIAIAIREAIEQPGRTVALVTPDRELARRVSAHLFRWGIRADDSAGRPLSALPPGTLLLALADVAAQRFAPVALLTLLKHPLVAPGGDRLAWLEGVRLLDRALRGPRPPAGIDGVTRHLAAASDERERRVRAAAQPFWTEAAALLRPFEAAFAGADRLPGFLAALREGAGVLGGEAPWAGPAGRALADLVARLEEEGHHAPAPVSPSALVPLLRQLLDEVSVRPPQGGHPRVFIWGLIEARLQSADLVILGGLNEGSWPQLPAPDPWLAPRIRRQLGLPGLNRRLGIAAHDFAAGLGGRRVLVTRARRDAQAPAVASRFWLRLEAMTGGLARATRLVRWADALDAPRGALTPAARPAPSPPAALRPRSISVTAVDRLKADPFAFYARAMLRLPAFDGLDAEPGPAWRGSAVHKVLEDWFREDRCDPATLRPRADALLAGADAHPLMRALWQPRLTEAIDWIARRMEEDRAAGRMPLRAEARGSIEFAGVTLDGIADRIDRAADGTLAIVDYKTGMPPGPAQVAAGFAMQLGLLGLIAERGGFDPVEGVPATFEYWSLAKKNGEFGHVSSPVGGRADIAPEDFAERAGRVFADAAARWLTGDAPFTAKLHPDHAPYGEYDQLMRLDEWYGRE